jgi:DNA polymerase III delta subunit
MFAMQKLANFISSVEHRTPGGVVLAGPEEFLRSEAEGAVVRAVFGSGDPGPGYVQLDGKPTSAETLEPAAVLDEVRSMSLFDMTGGMASGGGRKVVAVRRADALVKQHIDTFLAYLGQPVAGSVVILHMETWDKRSAYARKLDTWAVDCMSLYETAFGETETSAGAPLGRWVASRASRAHSVKLAPGAIVRLIQLTGTNLAELDGALGTLAVSSAKSKRALSSADVDACVAPSRTYTQFKIADLATAGKGAQAFAIADACFEQGLPDQRGHVRHAEAGIAESVIWAVSQRLEQIFLVKGLVAEGEWNASAAGRMGVPPFRMKEVEASARGASLDALTRALEIAFVAAKAVRGELEPRFAVERLLLELGNVLGGTPTGKGR